MDSQLAAFISNNPWVVPLLGAVVIWLFRKIEKNYDEKKQQEKEREKKQEESFESFSKALTQATTSINNLTYQLNHIERNFLETRADVAKNSKDLNALHGKHREFEAEIRALKNK